MCGRMSFHKYPYSSLAICAFKTPSGGLRARGRERRLHSRREQIIDVGVTESIGTALGTHAWGLSSV